MRDACAAPQPDHREERALPDTPVTAAPVLSEDLLAWIGRDQSVEDEVTLPAVRRIAATFDLPPDRFARGDALPPHWSTLFFPLLAPQSGIGPDGHPAGGSFLPPMPLPRRMFAGRRARFERGLRVGEAAVRRSEVAAIVPKAARTGPMILLTMRHTISAGDEVVMVEEQDAVYRAAVVPGAATAATPSSPAPADPDWTQTVSIDPVLLFRFSALTFNGHRIHYDADYVRDVEGYPGLVMNGGLTNLLLTDAALRGAGGRLLGLRSRLVRALFSGGRVTLAGRKARDGVVEAWAANEAGDLACSMELEVAR
jgi:3-methylfumaryl-CoA hydratase